MVPHWLTTVWISLDCRRIEFGCCVFFFLLVFACKQTGLTDTLPKRVASQSVSQSGPPDSQPSKAGAYTSASVNDEDDDHDDNDDTHSFAHTPQTHAGAQKQSAFFGRIIVAFSTCERNGHWGDHSEEEIRSRRWSEQCWSRIWLLLALARPIIRWWQIIDILPSLSLTNSNSKLCNRVFS